MSEKPMVNVTAEQPDAVINIKVSGDLPDGGADGQVLTRKDGRNVWADPPAGGGSGGGVPGAPGEDGGFYVPHVDVDGNLSWTASDGGMPSVDTVNIKGAKGDKGDPGEPGPAGPQGEPGEPGKDAEPYTLPTASETVKGGVKVGEGLRMDGDVLSAVGGSGGSEESELELIKTITITAEQAGVMEIVENFEVDYSGMVATVRFATTDGKSKYIYALFGRLEAATGTGGLIKPDDVIRQIARKLNGTWDIFCYIGVISGASSTCGQSSVANLYSTSSPTKPGFYKSFSAINYYRLYTFDAAGFPEGTEVKIFGMKEE